MTFSTSRFFLPTLNPTVQHDTVTTGITAFAGGGQTSATQLTTAINRITTCATGADSVRLPQAIKGACVFVANDGAASCTVYGYGTDTINGVATATGVALANAKKGIYVCYADGAWLLHLSA